MRRSDAYIPTSRETGEVELESRDGETRYVDAETALETVGRERRR